MLRPGPRAASSGRERASMSRWCPAGMSGRRSCILVLSLFAVAATALAAGCGKQAGRPHRWEQ